MMADRPALRIKLQVMCGDEIAMGPGKADLLDAIAREGSISAAGRALGMSYRRAWLLVDAMNRCWHDPLVETQGGGKGARVTGEGQRVLHHYRAMQKTAARAGKGGDWKALAEALRDAPLPARAG